MSVVRASTACRPSPIIHWPNPATLGAVHCASPTGRLHEVEETFEQTTAPCRAHSAKKLAQHGPFRGLSAKKLAQQAQKRRIWGVLSAQGELFRTFALTQRAGRTFSRPNETSDTFARYFASTHETGNAFARQQCRKIKHFVRAKVSTVSARQSVAPKRQAMHPAAHHCGNEPPPPQFRT